MFACLYFSSVAVSRKVTRIVSFQQYAFQQFKDSWDCPYIFYLKDSQIISCKDCESSQHMHFLLKTATVKPGL